MVKRSSYRLTTRAFWVYLFVCPFCFFNDTFNNISVISWRSVLLVEETGVPGENHRPAASIGPTVLQNVVSSIPQRAF
jgi:hypothetical protein